MTVRSKDPMSQSLLYDSMQSSRFACRSPVWSVPSYVKSGCSVMRDCLQSASLTDLKSALPISP
eukprot:4979914-Prymnesium_polylepis.1